MGVLYVVATPIGNMGDLSPRARETLETVELIAAEDTRHTGAMLKRLGIGTPMLSNHGFNERSRVDRLLGALSEGNVALVSDAGTPAISDPGAILVRAAAEAGYQVIPVPGASAMTAAVSASGLVEGPFTFLGFLPRSTGERERMLSAALDTGLPLVVFESGSRIEALAALVARLGPTRAVVVFRELTKLHEEAIRSTAAALPARLQEAILKGEFVVVISAGHEQAPIDIDTLIVEGLRTGERPSEMAKAIAKETRTHRSEVYARILELMQNNQGA